MVICTNDPLGATVAITTPLLQIEGLPINISVAAGTCEQIQLPRAIEIDRSGISNKGIHIRSTNGAKLTVRMNEALLLPCARFSSTSYKYFVFIKINNPPHAEIILVPCEDGLEISYTLPGGTQTPVPPLSQYQTYRIIQYRDLTGTIITSSGPLSVVTSNYDCITIWQIPPHVVYGQTFFALPLSSLARHSGDIFRVGSVTDNNVITVTCTQRTASGSPINTINTTSVTINTGDYHQLRINNEPGLRSNDYQWEFCCIETSKPAIVMRYSNEIIRSYVNKTLVSESEDDYFQYATLVPPVTQYSNNYLIFGLSTTSIPFISYAIAAKFFNESNNDRINFMVNRTTLFPASQCNNGSGGYIPIHCSNNEVCGYGAFTPIPAGTASISYTSPNAALFVSAHDSYLYYYRDGSYHEYIYPLTAGYELEPIGRELCITHAVGVSA